MTRKRILTAVALTACALWSQPARAGTSVYMGPIVSDGGGGGLAYGSLVDARASADPNTYIGCESWVQVGSSAILTWCYVQVGNRQGACYTSDLLIGQIARSINRNSWTYFRWDSSGLCQFLEVDNGSYVGMPVAPVAW